MKPVLRRATVVIVVAFAVVALASQWQRMRPHLDEMSAPELLAALLAGLAGVLASMLSWRALLADLGSALPPPAAGRVFFVGQLGKYLPGSVWPVVTQMELARRYAVPRVRTATAAVVAMVLSLLCGVLVAAATLPLVAADEARGYAWLLLAVPALAALLRPRTLNPLLRWALRAARRPPLDHAVTWSGIARAGGWAVLMWVCYGVQVWLLARDLGGSGAELLPLSLGAFAVAWSAGFLFVVAPAGVGVREAGIVLFLGPAIGTPEATVVAVCSRLLLTLADLVWAGVSGVTAGTVVAAGTPGQDAVETCRPDT